LKAYAYEFEIGKLEQCFWLFLIHVELCQISRGLSYFDLNSKEGKRRRKKGGIIGGNEDG
jgi:hypothetical protein